MSFDSTPLQYQPYREPLHVTLLRTGTIALVVGAVLAFSFDGIARWPKFTLLALWPVLGGHWVEIIFLNLLRPRLPGGRAMQIFARLIIWFIGGMILAIGMSWTAKAIGGARPIRLADWWIAGLGLVGIELTAHLVLQLRGRPSFYNGRG